MAALLPQQDFLDQYNISTEKFIKSGLSWPELEEIFADYQDRYEELDRAAFPLFNALIKMDNVHSVRYRIKAPEHVIEKIIRKKAAQPKRVITINNYLKELTDLIGLRAIHLFKDEWLFIHNAILDKWYQKEKPTYYYRAGDKIASKGDFKAIGCRTALHPRHYRSVHYIIKTTPTKQEYFAEIQVRTIFEEGWSEIDHKVGYPYSIDNQLQNDFLSILNRLAGSADEMSSFIKALPLVAAELKRTKEESERKVEAVKSDIDSNEHLSSPEKEKLIGQISQIGESSMSRVVREALEAIKSLPSNSRLLKSTYTIDPKVIETLKNGGFADTSTMLSILANIQSNWGI